MDQSQEKEFVKRIATLVKQNKLLSEQLKDVSDKNDKLSKKLDKYESIISRLRPEQIAEEGLSREPETLKFKMATVLFADIQGFDKISGNMNSQEMMDELDNVYFHFDTIVEKYKMEKIKTIGDSYMCAGGVPKKNSTNPIEVVLAALEMIHYLEDLKQKSEKHRIWDIRIGIHTGSVTATAVGKKKVYFDIKGDTVNIASRIVSVCKQGEINLSVNTYELVKEFFTCEYAGKLPVKYVGDMGMFYVKGLKPELSEDGQGGSPNSLFNTKFGLIQFVDIQELILDKLEKELPEYLHYHNVKHTIDVVTEVELIGWAEGVSDEEILLLKTAALFHDAGHTIGYDEHESMGAEFVREMLPKYNYTPEQIDIICDLILSTKMPPKPKTLLEKIMCDSDLDYLGRVDFIPVSNTLYEELKHQNKIGSLNDWNKLQIKFISGHQYFTQTARNLREVNKQKQIERIKELIVDE